MFEDFKIFNAIEKKKINKLKICIKLNSNIIEHKQGYIFIKINLIFNKYCENLYKIKRNEIK